MNSSLIVLIVAIVAAILLKWLLPSKGEVGERRVARILSKLPQEEYKVINNLLVLHKGHTTQIDHVVISEYRIFVIETKFYKGRIYGGLTSEYWTQNIYGKKYNLRNPIHQNHGHIRSLSALLQDIHPDFFIPIVAFSKQASVNCIDNKSIVYWNQLNKVIKSYQRKWLTTEQVQKVYDTLLAANIDSKENRKQHVKNIKRNIAHREQTIANGRCPRCGGNLVLRNGKYGKFYGCQNYPRCRFTHQA